MRRVVLLWNQSNTFGLSQDAALIEHAFRQIKGESFTFTRADPLQPPTQADIVIHLEVPHPVWLPWAPVQIWMVNPEWCSPKWMELTEEFTQIWVKELGRVKEFGSKALWVPWTAPIGKGQLKPVQAAATGSALWVLGGSQNKHLAARALLPKWPADCPVIVTTALEEADALPAADTLPVSVTIRRGFLEAKDLEDLNQASAIHVAISAAEGFGFTAAQAEARGAGLLLNTLPVYREYYDDKELTYVSFLETPCGPCGTGADAPHMGLVADFSGVSTEQIRAAYKSAAPDTSPNGGKGPNMAAYRLKAFTGALAAHTEKALQILKITKHRALPPVIRPEDCPSISVLTLTYNRRNFIDLAFLNLMTTDYPKEKIQWVVVDDSDDVNKMVLDKIKTFEQRGLGIEVTYVPLKKKHTIGYKRNKAVAAAKHEICVNMDDDDVYPETSFRRRVAWLDRFPEKQAVVCTMMAMYDLQHGISAVNVPPWALAQKERVSEASLAFRREYAVAHPFPDQQVAEGEGFLPPPAETLEIPPQQILVALNHGTNTSTRKLSGRAQTGCFWGWAPELIVWLHKLIGVEVEEEKSEKKSKK
jgi:hypothetical protein